MSGRVRSFRDLRVFRAAFAAAMEVFEASKRFPRAELFGLTRQIRNASRSVCANTAEAWRKRRYPKAFISKLSDAEAEAAETRVHLDFARACGYLSDADHARLDARYHRLTAQIVRTIRSANQWTVGRASGRRQAAEGRPSPTSHGEAVPNSRGEAALPQSRGAAAPPKSRGAAAPFGEAAPPRS